MMLSFKEFENKVYESYSEGLTAFSKEEKDAYFYSEEAMETMKREYERAINERKNIEAIASSCAYCLGLMFE